jgi:hypothetical protein
MELLSYFTRGSLASMVMGLYVLALAPGARAQPAIDPDAQSVLAAMSNYLGGLKSFSVDYSSADEVVTPTGEKLQFLHSGKIVVQRPNKLYASRAGAAGTAEIILDGNKLSLFEKDVNAYLQFDATSITAAIDVVHKLGFNAPGADLLATNPLGISTTDTISGTYIGDTFIDGIKVHQLAFRGAEVDWQVWVTTGDKPLPLRYVITTKWFTGAPQYTLTLRNWNTAPEIDTTLFSFVPPQGARKLDQDAVTVNAVGDMTIKGR